MCLFMPMTSGPLDMRNNQYDYNLLIFSYEKYIHSIFNVTFSDVNLFFFTSIFWSSVLGAEG